MEEQATLAPEHIEQQDVLDSLRRESRVAHALLGLSAALAELRPVGETLRLAVNIVPQVFGADRCFAATWSATGDRLLITAHAGFDDRRLEMMEGLAASDHGLPLVRKVIAGGKPAVVPDAATDGRIPAEEVARRRLGAYICIPLQKRGEEFGCIGVEFSEPRALGPAELALAQGVTSLVGYALANARQFDLLESLRNFGQRIGSKLRLHAVVDEISSGARELLSGDSAYVYFQDSSGHSLIAAGSNDSAETLPAQLFRLDLDAEPWSRLLDGDVLCLPSLRRHIGLSTGPAGAVGAPIPSTASSPGGAVVVFFDEGLSVDQGDVEALRVLSGQSAMALENAQRFERQRSVARSLQRGLLLNELPSIDGCIVGAVYEPASGEADIGGDFFDVFEVSDGKVAFVVGDVSGKGAEAAAETAMAKYMLRAFAMSNPGPASVLFHLNNALVQGMVEDRFATVVYGIFDPRSRTAVIGRAGHPAPMVYRAETRTVEVLDIPGGLLGVFEDQQFEQQTIVTGPQDIIVAFTDGLLEARSETDFYGAERAEGSLLRHALDASARELPVWLYEDAKRFGEVTDDTVVFALAPAEWSTV